MAGLTKDRDTIKRTVRGVASYKVGAGKRIYAGALVVLAGGFAEPGTAAPGKRAVGRANAPVNNAAGGNGDATVTVERGTFFYANDGTISQADVGSTCYVVDDQTVARTDGGGTRSPAGVVQGVEPTGVWVEI